MGGRSHLGKRAPAKAHSGASLQPRPWQVPAGVCPARALTSLLPGLQFSAQFVEPSLALGAGNRTPSLPTGGVTLVPVT